MSKKPRPRVITLHPLHHSVIKSLKHHSRTPAGLTTIPGVTDEQRVFLEEQALHVFSLAVNGGTSFQQALATVYATGLHDAMCTLKAGLDEPAPGSLSVS